MKVKVFIDEEWISGETCLFNITDPIMYSRAKRELAKMRCEFINRLENDGYNVITSRDEIDDDTIYFIMDSEAINLKGESLREYKKEFDRRIFAAGGDKLNYPRSLSLNEYFEEPFLPVVFKNESTNGGEDKFFIDSLEQVAKIKLFYQKYRDISPYKEAFECTIMQQYIEPVCEYDSYVRVLLAGSGDVLGASIKYSQKNGNKKVKEGIFERYFSDESSNYYLNAKSMFGYYSGGGSISFFQPRFSSEKQRMLKKLGFDEKNLEIPSEVLEVSQNIVTNCNRELGIICGIDFIQDGKDGKWYYLENQAFPAIDEWAQARDKKVPASHDIKGYLKYLELDIEARYEALNLTVLKRKNNNEMKLKLSNR